MARLWPAAVIAWCALQTGALAQEAPNLVYRSDLLVRTTGKPDVYRTSFEPCDPTGRFWLVVENGVEGSRVSSGTILLNGVPVIEPRDLNEQVARIERSVVLVASNTLEVRLASGPGGRVRVTVDGHMRCVRVRITAPLAGSVLRDPATLVEGEVESRGPAGVQLRVTATIGGRPLDLFVPVAVQGRRFAAWAPLPRGPVQFVALASDQTGRTAEDAVMVTFDPDPPDNDRPVRPEVSPTVGFAPLAVTFGGQAASDDGIDQLDLDVDGDGRPDFTLTDFAVPPHQVTYTYPAEGLYVATMVLRDKTTGQSITSRVPINVIPVPDLTAIWDGFRATLGAGDVEGALRYVADEARERYRRVFEDLRTDLAAVAGGLQDITPQVVQPEYATAGTTGVRDGQVEGFLIHFLRDGDGVWRIASM